MTLHQKTINADRLELLNALRTNLERHRSEYTEALVDYQQFITNELYEAWQKAVHSDLEQAAEIRRIFNPPADHSKDYEDAMAMLEFSVDDKIELNAESFKAYVKNEWSWSALFQATNASYKVHQ